VWEFWGGRQGRWLRQEGGVSTGSGKALEKCFTRGFFARQHREWVVQTGAGVAWLAGAR